MTRLLCVESLTLRAWLGSVAPWVVRKRLSGWRGRGRVLAFEGTRLGWWAARCSAWMLGLTLERFHFFLIHARDTDGVSLRLKVACEDLVQVQRAVLETIVWRPPETAAGSSPRLRTAVAAALSDSNIFGSGNTTLTRLLLAIRACAWRIAGEPPDVDKTGACFFVEQRPWFDAVARFAAR